MSNKYGELMLLHLGEKPTLVVSSPTAAKEIMKTHDEVFSNRPKTGTIKRLCYGGKDVAFSDYGEYWRQVKSLCRVRLLSTAKVRSFRSIREEEVAIMVDRIKGGYSSSRNGCRVINLSEAIVCFTNDVICRAAFGRKYSSENNSNNNSSNNSNSNSNNGRNFDELVKTFQDLLGGFSVGDFIPWLSWLDRLSGVSKKVDKIREEIDSFLEEIIEEHVAKNNCDGVGKIREENKKDFVDVLLEAQRGDGSGLCFDRECVKALMLDIFAAGIDTSYATIEWTMSELLRHPNVMEQLQQEVRNITQGKEYISEQDLTKMHYLKAVIKETLRMHPPDPLLVFRESSQDVTIKGYDIKNRTQVIINAWAIHRDPTSWERPNDFDPRRFEMTQFDFTGQDFRFIPFGAGRRSCPGITFATSSMELLLANLVNSFDWELPVNVKPKSLDMTETSGVVIHRRDPLLVIATPFHSAHRVV
ncbi:hypothetical protein vseg_003964 [Gypsophila vaccaria]